MSLAIHGYNGYPVKAYSTLINIIDMTRNWKHTMQSKFKPYEIVVENRDPILWPNSPDAPAGFANIQRRKWKLWINALTWAMFSRKSKYENEWVLIPTGSCPENIVPYNNHYVVGRTIWTESQSFLWRDYRNQIVDFTTPYECSIWIWDNIAPQSYVNWISAVDINDLYSQILSNYFQFINDFNPTQITQIQVFGWWTGFYIVVDGAIDNNLQITFQDNFWTFFDWSWDPEDDWILWIAPSLFTINWIPNWPCELFELPPSWGNSTYVPTPQIRYLKNDTSVDWIRFEAYFNQADRWILDYEPEIYLYFLKWWGWYKNHTNRSTRKRIAHMAQTDEFWIPSSLKLTINPRLRWLSWRNWTHNTEWLVDWSKPDMATKFVIQPFQFLWRINNASTWIWSFPINPAIWNTSGTWTEFPPTLSKRWMWDQDSSPNEDITIACCFKLVIKNPTNPEWFPIESDISEIFKIRPNIKRNESDYSNRRIKVNR